MEEERKKLLFVFVFSTYLPVFLLKFRSGELVGCGIKFRIQRALSIEIWVKTPGDMSKIQTQKVVFFFLPPKLINIILLFELLFYYFNYYFIIFLRRPILDPKIPLMYFPLIVSHLRNIKIRVNWMTTILDTLDIGNKIQPI